MNTFNFKSHELRTIEIEGAPWFVAADVCRILDIYIIKSTSYPNVTRIKQQLGAAHFITQPLTGGDGVTRNTNYVDEPGLYKLIMRSDKATARPFQDWVTKEVLPAIRKTGGYLLNEEARMTAHADTRSAMPLPEAFQQVFDHFMKPIVDKIDEQNAVIVSLKEHIEKLASGESPDDIWLSGDLVRDMSDQHIRNAIRWAKKNATDYSVLTREQARRIRLKKAA